MVEGLSDNFLKMILRKFIATHERTHTTEQLATGRTWQHALATDDSSAATEELRNLPWELLEKWATA